ncbi:MAG: hypothetical protein HC884_13985 [Chloroflexaceae bacterium]|nr:hypothetical protein [Chloroflexaceae bacterium]
MSTPPKDTGLAMILEILPGIFGFLGIGHIYAGYTTTGILLLIGWWVILFILTVITVLTAGLGIFCQGSADDSRAYYLRACPEVEHGKITLVSACR